MHNDEVLNKCKTALASLFETSFDRHRKIIETQESSKQVE
jgi:hypothetical protein